MIPRVLHRVVPAEVPDRFEGFWDGWRALHPGWEHRTWQDPLDPADWPLTRDAWPHVTCGAQLAGLVRLEAVWREGGIFLDWDVRPVGRCLAALLTIPGGAFVAWEDDDHIPDAVFGAEPRHPAVGECLVRAVGVTVAGGGPWAAAVGVFTDVWPDRIDATVLPRESFYPIGYNDRPGARAYEPPEGGGTFGVHEWRWSWGPPDQQPKDD